MGELSDAVVIETELVVSDAELLVAEEELLATVVDAGMHTSMIGFASTGFPVTVPPH